MTPTETAAAGAGVDAVARPVDVLTVSASAAPVPPCTA